jgi:hypothetical protein
MLLSRAEFITPMAEDGIAVEPGSPLWAYEDHHNLENSWFVRLRVPDLAETMFLLREKGIICYLVYGRDKDRLTESWWGMEDHAVAMELWMRWG